LRADGARVVGTGGVAVTIGRTPSALAAELGVTAGRPEGAYGGGSGVDPDEVLTLVSPERTGVTPAAARRRCHALSIDGKGDAAPHRLRWRRLSWDDESAFVGEDGELGPVAGVDLGEDAGDV
jgi:hypothetical protein